MRTLITVLITLAPAFAQRVSDLVTPLPIASGQVLAVGFLGAIEKWNDPDRSVRKVALDLRAQGYTAETFENRHWKSAVAFIHRALDTNGDGRLDATERSRAHVILYGQSLGGDAAIHAARALHKLRIPVLLTVQVDSVGLHDAVIPPNVHEAVNYYQHDGFTIQGRRHIRAADPEHTRIIGNFERTYRGQAPGSPDATWVRRTFGGGHARMEMDPELWTEIRGLLLDAAHK